MVFYAGLRPVRPCAHRLVYAVIGLFRVGEVVRLREVKRADWAANAHTRRLSHHCDDVIVRAKPGESGRLLRCLPIGELRSGAYRVRNDLLRAWDGLSCKDGFIQRSAVPPSFLAPAKFLAWFEAQNPTLIAANNIDGASEPRMRAPKAKQAALVAAKGETLARRSQRRAQASKSPGQARAKKARTGGRVLERPRNKRASTTAPVVIVVLRQPRRVDRRTDPLYEFGSCGLTGCHAANLLANDAAAGCRLAAPILIDNDGCSDITGLHDHLAAVRRISWTARFASAFRARKKPIAAAMRRSIVNAWERAARDPRARATAYWHALPRKPTPVDINREATYRRLQTAAAGGRSPRRCR